MWSQNSETLISAICSTVSCVCACIPCACECTYLGLRGTS